MTTRNQCVIETLIIIFFLKLQKINKTFEHGDKQTRFFFGDTVVFDKYYIKLSKHSIYFYSLGKLGI